MSYKNVLPHFDNWALYDELKALDSRFEHLTSKDDEIPSFGLTGEAVGFARGQVLMQVYIPFSPNSEHWLNDAVGVSVFDAEEYDDGGDHCSQHDIEACESMIKDALDDCMILERPFVVFPRIRLNLPTPQRFMMNKANNNFYCGLAIDQVKAMDAEQLKQAVIDGLQDSDAYPQDFAEY